MPNYCCNELRITCEIPEMMSKIKNMLFTIDESGSTTFSMERMIPMPEDFASRPGFSEYGRDWAIVNWGTKWDVVSPEIKESGVTSITIIYATAWGPNDKWVERLCRYIYKAYAPYPKEPEGRIEIYHSCYEPAMGINEELTWSPGKEFKYEHVQ